MKFIGALICSLAACIVGQADHCRVRVVQQHVQAVEVQHVAIAQIVAVPAYQIQYAPQSEDVRALVAEIRALRAEVQAIKGAPVTVPDKKELAPSPLKHTEILQAKCAACHDATVSKSKGGSFTMFDKGSLALLSDRQLRKVSTRTYAGDMPPKGQPQLTDQEVGEIQRWLNSLE